MWNLKITITNIIGLECKRGTAGEGFKERGKGNGESPGLEVKGIKICCYMYMYRNIIKKPI
jgi:hypothetical protein